MDGLVTLVFVLFSLKSVGWQEKQRHFCIKKHENISHLSTCNQKKLVIKKKKKSHPIISQLSKSPVKSLSHICRESRNQRNESRSIYLFVFTEITLVLYMLWLHSQRAVNNTALSEESAEHFSQSCLFPVTLLDPPCRSCPFLIYDCCFPSFPLYFPHIILPCTPLCGQNVMTLHRLIVIYLHTPAFSPTLSHTHIHVHTQTNTHASMATLTICWPSLSL